MKTIDGLGSNFLTLPAPSY